MHLIAKLVSLLAIVQSLEFLRLKQSISSVWRWDELKEEYPPWLRATLGVCLKPCGFLILNILRIGLALWLFTSPDFIPAAGLLVIHLLTLLRFRGTFNGGSDSMNFLLLICLAIGFAAEPDSKFVTGALWYIALQLCLSYFKAGFVKLKEKQWRNGSALGAFLTSPVYEPRPWLLDLSRKSSFTFLASWLIIGFELSFPLSLIHPHVAFAYMVVGVVFHLTNAYIFGLNRFVFAWLAAYPALF
jgi:hypothetical protein